MNQEREKEFDETTAEEWSEYADPTVQTLGPVPSYPMTTDTLATAFLKVQQELKNPTKDSVNPYFESQYLSLPALLESVLPILNKYGFSLLNDIKAGSNGAVLIWLILLHESGERMSFGPLEMPVGRADDPQARGTAITYGRRYIIESVLGISGKDDDAESAMPAARAKISQPRATGGTPTPHAAAPAEQVNATVQSIGRKSERHPFIITTDQGDFSTYDKNVATAAELARSTNCLMQIKYVFDQKWNERRIVSEKPKDEK